MPIKSYRPTTPTRRFQTVLGGSRRPGEADARRDIPVIADVRLPFIPQTVTEGQIGAQTPVVLRKKSQIVLHDARVGIAGIDAELRGAASQLPDLGRSVRGRCIPRLGMTVDWGRNGRNDAVRDGRIGNLRNGKSAADRRPRHEVHRHSERLQARLKRADGCVLGRDQDGDVGPIDVGPLNVCLRQVGGEGARAAVLLVEIAGHADPGGAARITQGALAEQLGVSGAIGGAELQRPGRANLQCSGRPELRGSDEGSQ